MDFSFSEEQLALRDSVEQFMQSEVTPEWIRERWKNRTALDAELWQKMVDLGLLSILAPEAYGGLGLTEVDFVLLAEQCGQAALPGELVDTVLVALPLLSELAEGNERCAEILNALVTGEQRLIVQHAVDPLINDADLADWLILSREKRNSLAGQNRCVLDAVSEP